MVTDRVSPGVGHAGSAPSEDYERVFHTWIGWARYGAFFAYDETSGVISQA